MREVDSLNHDQLRLTAHAASEHEIKGDQKLPGASQSQSSHDLISLRDASHYRIFGRVHLQVSEEMPANDPTAPYAYIKIDDIILYHKFCQDFGPLNLLMVYNFCLLLDDHILQNLHRSTALFTEGTSERLTNATYLLGAYMVMRLGSTPEQALERFSPLQDRLTAFRDILNGPSTFDLHLIDCLQALAKAKELGWIDFTVGSHCFDPDEYAYFDNPLNADLHEIVPGKILSMRCPRDLEGGAEWQDIVIDGKFSHRDFSPGYYKDILQQFGVQAVIRLCAPQYPHESMVECNAVLVDLPCDEGLLPPPDIVAKFLAIAEGLSGAVALQSKVGLGRTGVLAGLYLMKHHGFTGRQAIAWMRIVRPGSVFGEQQAFLVKEEALLRRSGETFRECGRVEGTGETESLPHNAPRNGESGGRARLQTAAEMKECIAAILRTCGTNIDVGERRCASASAAIQQDLHIARASVTGMTSVVFRQQSQRALAWREAVHNGRGGNWASSYALLESSDCGGVRVPRLLRAFSH